MAEVGYLTPNENYFYKAILYVMKKTLFNFNKFYVFVVCTDDPKWVKHNFEPARLIAFAKTRKVPKKTIELIEKIVRFEIMQNITARDKALCLLTLMDHMIMSVGTFGWWAAFLNENNFKHFCTQKLNNPASCIAPKKPILIYFKTPFREGSPVSAYFSLEDHFPSRWIGISSD